MQDRVKLSSVHWTKHSSYQPWAACRRHRPLTPPRIDHTTPPPPLRKTPPPTHTPFVTYTCLHLPCLRKHLQSWMCSGEYPTTRIPTTTAAATRRSSPLFPALHHAPPHTHPPVWHSVSPQRVRCQFKCEKAGDAPGQGEDKVGGQAPVEAPCAPLLPGGRQNSSHAAVGRSTHQFGCNSRGSTTPNDNGRGSWWAVQLQLGLRSSTKGKGRGRRWHPLATWQLGNGARIAGRGHLRGLAFP
jgi:hypothetical protein